MILFVMSKPVVDVLGWGPVCGALMFLVVGAPDWDADLARVTRLGGEVGGSGEFTCVASRGGGGWLLAGVGLFRGAAFLGGGTVAAPG